MSRVAHPLLLSLQICAFFVFIIESLFLLDESYLLSMTNLKEKTLNELEIILKKCQCEFKKLFIEKSLLYGYNNHVKSYRSEKMLTPNNRITETGRTE